MLVNVFSLSEIEEVVLSEVDQTLKNASVFKGKNMVGEPLTLVG